MSIQKRPKPTDVLVCDICGDEIDKSDPDSFGKMVGSYNTPSNTTKHIRFNWPPDSWLKGKTWSERREEPVLRSRTYDFHGLCALNLVERVVEERIASEQV